MKNSTKKEIFIIDDDPIYRMLVSRMLKNNDSVISIHECQNGQIGLDNLQNPENITDQIIVLLDINMPVMNGWEFLDQLIKYNFYNIRNLNLYMISSSTDESDLLNANQYGFIKDFFHKPLSSQNIQSILGTA